MFEIRTPKTDAEWIEYFNLRYKILRAPLKMPIGSEKNDGDKNAQHFALFDEEVIKSIGRLDAVSDNIAQIRFFCTDENCQGKGYGKKLMQEIEVKAKAQHLKKIILHARVNAVPFYKSIGYSTLEKSHLLYGQIQHYLMEKLIEESTRGKLK